MTLRIGDAGIYFNLFDIVTVFARKPGSAGFTGTVLTVGADGITIDGGGHTWPGGEPLPEWLTGPTTQDIDATRVMWEFFGRFAIGG